MFKGKKHLLAGALFVLMITILYACMSKKTQTTTTETVSVQKPRILVYTRTRGFYHQSIPAGKAGLMKLGNENNFLVDTTSNPAYFVEDSLKHYNAVVFLSTTMNVLNAEQQVAFERYIQAGGGFVGIHAAADTEYDWPWYNKLVGAYFLSHPRQQKAIVQIVDKTHPSTSFLPERWERFDEWYNYKSIYPGIKVLATLDESTYQGGQNGSNHPIAWYHEYDGGRSFYTGGGHTDESFSDSLFMRHLLEGVRYAMAKKPLDYSRSYAVKSPEENRFTKTVLSNDLNEPMELTVAPDGRVFFTERAGNFYMYDPVSRNTKLLRQFPTKAVDKYLNGLIGITLDPDFAMNNYIYFFYSSNTGGQYHQNISRFKITQDNVLDTATEQIIIKIPIDLEVSAHTGGSLAWDKHKNLFISTGDNTVPFESHGYAPLDERPGRNVYDAQRSAGNPNDLRGKILRIHPEADGSYTIPEGNLFPKGTPGTRPEIYVMGCRNPYRIAVDTATSWLYWGEVGPDAGRDSKHGPRGYDEFNQAKGPGNFGWPYFVGDTKAYNDSNFATQEIGPLFDVNGPENRSPNNTGATKLPPPQKAFIWYAYNRSDEFPLLGDGGRCAMGGPIYHYNASLTNPARLPAYYDKAWFVYDWMRNWVFAVRMDANGNYQRMERFMETNGDFRRPVDIEFAPDGTMYMLEYGSVYGIDNVDARLVRIDFNPGNRSPVAQIATNDTIGIAPYRVAFNSGKSYDFDEDDKLTYEWNFGDNTDRVNRPNAMHTYAANGVYKAVLKITDGSGASSTDTMEIKVGNTLPNVVINTQNNSTFFFNKPTALNYQVAVTDKEDETINKERLKIHLKYIPKIAGNDAQIGHQMITANYNLGKNLLASSDCSACHQLNAKSVGPSFTQVSMKYKDDKNAVGYLANKVITGGGGVWGEHAMNAHPQLSKEDATEIVKYVLSVADQKEEKALADKGQIVLSEHTGNADEGRYILTASYTDNGGAIVPLTNQTTLVLRPARIPAPEFDVISKMQRQGRRVSGIGNGSFFVLRNIDLADVDSVSVGYAAREGDAQIEVRLDSVAGPLLTTINYKATGAMNRMDSAAAPINATTGKKNLFFVFRKEGEPASNIAAVAWVKFIGGEEAKPQPATKTAAKQTKPAQTKPSQTKSPAAKATTTAAKPSANVTAGRTLYNGSDCKACHTPTTKLVGPALTEIAARYAGQAGAVNRLADKVIKGGAGVWGQIPMSPHPQLSQKQASQMVEYILSLKK